MATYPMVKFMASPAAAAAVRFDFNAIITSGFTRVLHNETFDLGAPDLQGEPDGIEVGYGLRQISLTLQVEGTRVNALATQSRVARELLRADNWLMVKLAADREAVWFHTYRAPGSSLSFEHVDNDDGPDAWNIRLSIPAEDFAYGERVSLSPITINNNPASGSNPCSAVLPAIVGDAPSALRIGINPSNAIYMDGFRLMFSVIAAADAPSAPIVWQVGGVDGWTAGTDTGASGADAAMSGGTRRRVSFATVPGMATRLNGNAPAALAAGKYKVLVRVARSDLDSTFALRLGQGMTFTYWYNDTAVFDRGPSTGAGHATWVDLGEITHPRGHQSPDGQYGVASIPDIALQAQRLTGTGQLDLDVFMLVPLDLEAAVESRTLFVEFPVSGPADSTGTTIFDGDLEYIWGFNSVAASHPLTPEPEGQFLRVTPGAEHFLTFLQQVNGRKPWLTADTPDLITVSTVLDISYYPRFQWVGDG